LAKRWLEVSIRATAEAAEAVTAIFEQAGHGGVVIEPELVQGHEEDEPVPAPGGYAVLRTFIPEGADLSVRREKVEQAVGVLRAFDLAPMDELQFRWVSEEDWANAWKQHYQVHRIGRRWVIKPRWQEYAPQPGDAVVDLDPGMAFGTGLHPTTQLVLELLEDLADAGEVADKELLDLGTGSGILAIGAARLEAARVTSMDVDAVATSAAEQNVAANGLSDRVAVRQATLGAPLDGVVPVAGEAHQAAFDGILANIITRVIAERAPAIARALRPGGWLIASGIIADRAPAATTALAAAGLIPERRLERGDWVALLYRKPLPTKRGE
jgi:ribosomal protein L11 methyltransferase